MSYVKNALGSLVVAGLLFSGYVQPTMATIQDDDIMCWYPDVETPSGCDGDED